MTPDYRQLVQTTEPADEPVTLPEAKAHLRVTFDRDDLLIGSQISAAREWVEGEVNRALVTRSYDLSFDAFYPLSNPFPGYGLGLWTAQLAPERPFLPISGEIRPPKPPLIAVDSIRYLDPDGIPTVLDPSRYKVLAGGRLPGTICPAYGLSWPASRVEIGSVVISYRAGYGSPQDVPRALKAAILLMAGNLYRNREATTDVAQVEVPFAVRSLLSKYRWKVIG